MWSKPTQRIYRRFIPLGTQGSICPPLSVIALPPLQREGDNYSWQSVTSQNGSMPCNEGERVSCSICPMERQLWMGLCSKTNNDFDTRQGPGESEWRQSLKAWGAINPKRKIITVNRWWESDSMLHPMKETRSSAAKVFTQLNKWTEKLGMLKCREIA